MAFATGMQARLPLDPLTRGFLTTPQASLDAADWPVAPRPASTPGSRPTPGAALPGTLASPRTGLAPAGCRELALGYTINLPSTSAPELLDAHSSGSSAIVISSSRNTRLVCSSEAASACIADLGSNARRAGRGLPNAAVPYCIDHRARPPPIHQGNTTGGLQAPRRHAVASSTTPD
jgi:hypothetical protein